MKQRPFCEALITGAAGELGSRMARRFAGRGVDLVLVDRDANTLAAVAGELAGSVRVASYVADQTDLDEFERIVRTIAGEHGGIDLVVANAGLDQPQRVTAPDWRLAKKHFDVHAVSNYVLLAEFLPRFVERGYGHVAAIVSLGALLGCPYAHAYNASKAALAMMVDGMRAETRGTGVTWTSVFPGFLEGRMAAGNAWRQAYRIPMDTAADRIVAGIAARRAIVAFPWREVLRVKAAAWLPTALRDRVVASAMRSRDELELRVADRARRA